MANVTRRTWLSRGPTGRRVRKYAFGYSLVVDGQQERRYDSGWSRQDAEAALAARLLGLEAPKPAPAAGATFGEVAARYLEVKRGKRTWKNDQRTLERLLAALGRDVPVAALTAERIAQYQAQRKAEKSARRRADEDKPAPVSAATVNRELALLRHLLVLAEEWGHVGKVPRIRLEREPEGRLRFLTEDEISRLLTACEASAHPELATVVTLALNTGMRKGELLGLTWDRVDFSRGVLLLERTKSGRRREVPMNDAVDAALSHRPGPREGRVFLSRSIRKGFDKAVEAAKLEDFRFHDLRHTAASYLIMRGASLADVRAVLGHTDIKMTMRYAHLSPEHLRAAISCLDGLTPSRRGAAATAQGQHKAGTIEPASRATA